jgi:hypothetical protein
VIYLITNDSLTVGGRPYGTEIRRSRPTRKVHARAATSKASVRLSRPKGMGSAAIPRVAGQSSETRMTSPPPTHTAQVVTYAAPPLSATPYGADSPPATVSCWLAPGVTFTSEPIEGVPGGAGMSEGAYSLPFFSLRLALKIERGSPNTPWRGQIPCRSAFLESLASI